MIVPSDNLEVLVSPTMRCNLRCRYCYVDKNALGSSCDMTFEDMRCAFAWLREYADAVKPRILRFTWFGGEPLLLGAEFLKSALEIQGQELKGLDYVNNIQTNLVCDVKPFVELFKRYFNSSVGFSFDVNGGHRRTVDGCAVGNMVVQHVRFLQSCGISLGAVSTLTKADVGRGRYIYEAFRNLGVRFRVNRAASSPTMKAEGELLTLEEYESLVREIADCYFADEVAPVVFHNMDLMIRAYLGGRAMTCVDTEHPEKFIGLEAEGRILPRCRFCRPIGDYRHDSPQIVAARLRKTAFAYEKPGKCAECEFWGRVCIGGCPGERTCDCSASDCGYRTESTCGIWRYVADKVKEIGLSYGVYSGGDR